LSINLYAVALGGGQHLEALTSLFGCSKKQYPKITQILHIRYLDIFEKNEALKMRIENIFKIIKSEPILLKQCSFKNLGMI